MADYIPDNAPIRSNIHTPLTLTALQTYVEGFIKFVELQSGDVMIVNEAGPAFAPINQAASKIAGQIIHGHVILCSPSEIE